jgi:hypothetical protein
MVNREEPLTRDFVIVHRTLPEIEHAWAVFPGIDKVDIDAVFKDVDYGMSTMTAANVKFRARRRPDHQDIYMLGANNDCVREYIEQHHMDIKDALWAMLTGAP